MRKTVASFMVLVFWAGTINPSNVLYVRKVAGGVYDCDVDPQGNSWVDVKLVLGMDDVTDPTTGNYTIANDDYSAATVQVLTTNGGSGFNGASAHRGSAVGMSDLSTGGKDDILFNDTSHETLGVEEGVLNFDLWFDDGGGGSCAAGDGFFLMRDRSTGGFWFRIELAGDETGGWDLRVSFWDTGGSTIATATNAVLEGTVYNITATYNSTTAGRDTGTDYLRLYVNDGIDGSPEGENTSGMDTMLTSTTGQVSFNDVRVGAYNCHSRLDNIWISIDPTFDVFNHVTGGDGTYGDGNECFAKPASL